MKKMRSKGRQTALLAGALLLLFIAITWSITSGEYKMTLGAYFRTLFGGGDDLDRLIFIEFRMPRIAITMLAGMALSLSGAIIQSITKNPLAEPGILGINAGGGLAIAILIILGQANPNTFVYVLPIVSVIGGMLTAFAIFIVSYDRSRGIDPPSMVLIGVGFSTVLTGASFMIVKKFNEDQAEFISSWLAGRIWGDEWAFVIAFLPWILILVPFLLSKANVLDILTMHDDTAKGLGVPMDRERIMLLVAAVILSSATVAVAGAISFIGLMAPHIARRLSGPRHHLFMPLALLIGAILLVVADTAGQAILTKATIPAGIVVAVIGAPYFLFLMSRKDTF